MANYYSFVVTEKTFRVKESEAFKTELARLGVEVATYGDEPPLFDGLTVIQEEDGGFWLGGHDARLTFDDDSGSEVDVLETVQRHLADGEVAVVHEVGHEKLRYVIGVVYVVTPQQILVRSLSELQDRMLQAVEG